MRKEIPYVLMNPSGNLTCLVLSPVAEEDRAAVTAMLMNRCEQVGYLMPPENPACAARLRMMGDEFCGNASMAAAAWLASRDRSLPDDTAEMLLEVSGAEAPVPCAVKRETENSWTGRVRMPDILGSEPCLLRGERLEAVHLPGMTHLIANRLSFSPSEAESLLRAAAERFRDPALGLIQWEQKKSPDDDVIRGEMKPLVYVRGSETMVWESACGSGTAAAAWLESRRRGKSLSLILEQPGGTLTARTEWSGGLSVWLLGHVTVQDRGTALLG